VSSPVTACPASATSATIPKDAYLSDMALTSPTEGWAVGARQNDAGAPKEGLILQFHQCRWRPVALDLPNIMLSHISMDSPTDGWAVGHVADASQTSASTVLLHYSGGVWSAIAAPPALQVHLDISALRMRTPDDGWIVALGPATTGTAYVSAYADTLLHDIQGTWVSVACPLPMIDDLTPVGPNDLWIAGTAFVAGSGKATTHSFAHYHDGHWTVMAQPAGLWISSLHAVSSTDIWASGRDSLDNPAIAHYDGTGWRDTSDALLKGGEYGIVVALGDDTGWAFTVGLASTEIPQTAEAQLSITDVSQEVGGQWQSLNWRYSDITRLVAWAPVSDTEVWAVGSSVTYSPPTPLPGGGSTSSGRTNTVLLHYADGAWSRYD
jgi:hypothetical protein